MASACAAFDLLAVACSSTSEPITSIAETSSEVQDGNSAAESTASDIDPLPATTAEQSGDEPVINEVYVSPSGEALGVAQDEAAAAFDTYVNDAEELVRSCMVEAGFDYTPVPTGFDQQRRQAELEATLTPEQFTAEYQLALLATGDA